MIERRRFLELPMDAKDEILQLQAELLTYRKGVDDWCDYYRALRRMQVPPGDPQNTHETIKQLLSLSTEQKEGVKDES